MRYIEIALSYMYCEYEKETMITMTFTLHCYA